MSQFWSRRSLLAGAAGAGALLRLRPGLAQRAQPLSAPACMQQNAIDGLLIDRSSNSLNSRAMFFAPSGSGIRDLVLSFPQWYFAGNETDWPEPYTVAAAVEYPEGKFTPVFRAGERRLTVNPGNGQAEFDACPVAIPPGARFFVRTWAQWRPGAFPLGSGVAVNWPAGECCYLQTDAADLTLTTERPGQTSFAAGFAPSVFGRLDKPTPALGVLGDSIARAVGPDSCDPATDACFVRRAVGNNLPVLDANCGGHTFSGYFTRHSGRDALLRHRITHLIIGFGRNDLSGPFTAVQVEAALRRCAEPFQADGVVCYAFTALPTTTSTDGWATRQNQQIWNVRAERERALYNDRLRAGWRGFGLAGIFDIAGAVESAATGYWNTDGTPGHNAGGYATVAGGQVQAVAPAINPGAGYPPTSAIPCVVVNQPGDDSGEGAVVTAHTDARGAVVSYAVENPGRSYALPPWVTPRGAWTNDGVHPDKRGYDQMIVRSGLSAAAFLRA